MDQLEHLINLLVVCILRFANGYSPPSLDCADLVVDGNGGEICASGIVDIGGSWCIRRDRHMSLRVQRWDAFDALLDEQ